VGTDIKALLVTSDPGMVNVFSPLLQEMRIMVQYCPDESTAAHDVLMAKFEAVFLDCDHMPGNIPVIKSLRESRSNKNAVVVAVASNSAARQQAFDQGANFAFERPFVVPDIKKTLHAAYGLMLRERRRYFRHAIEIPVRARRDSGEELSCKTINLSQNGMALSVPSPLSQGEVLGLVFSVPDAALSVSARGTVVWADTLSKVGISFQCTNPEVESRLTAWLHDRFYTQFDIAQTQPAAPKS